MPAVVDAAGPEPLICAVLRHEPCVWDDGGDPALAARFIRAAGFHGVLPLLDEEFRVRSDWGSWPKEILMACLTAALNRRNVEQAHRPASKRALRNRTVEQQFDVLVPRIARDAIEGQQQRLATPLEQLQEVPSAMKQQAGEPALGVAHL